MRKILFFNNYHIGDVFLPVSFIKNIVASNPDVDFYYWCHEGHNFFKDINIKFAVDITHDILKPVEEIVESRHEDYELINTWIVGFWKDKKYKDIPVQECDLWYLYEDFKRVCELNNLNFTLNKKDLFFTMPKVDLRDVLPWFFANKNKKKIFYFNYLARSCQPQAIESMSDHENVINSLANHYPDRIVIVPDGISSPLPNVINCQEAFGITRSPSSEHLIKLHAISNMCNHVVYFDTGGCFLFMNEESLNTPNTKILLTREPSVKYGIELNKTSMLVNNRNCMELVNCMGAQQSFESIINIISNE
jgi:hypothetical protein